MTDLLNKLLKEGAALTEKRVSEYESVLKKQYTAAWKGIDEEIRNLYLKYGDPPPIKELYKFNRLKNMQLRIGELLKDRLKVSRSVINESIKSSLENGYYTQGWAWKEWFQGVGVNINFGLFDPNSVLASVITTKLKISNPLSREKITGYIFKNRGVDGKWIWENSLKDLNSKAYRRINNAITQGIIRGEGYNKTAREVKKQLFGDKKRGFNVTKALERIIRTETGKAHALANTVAYHDIQHHAKRVGIKTVRIWDATLDDRVRDDHLALHNKPENEDKQWILNGTPTDGPRQTGRAGDDINCRCDWRVETEGLKSTFDESKVAKKLNPDKYEIWKKGQK